MTTTTIDSRGIRSEGDDNSPIFKKINEILSDLKKGSSTQNSRIERAIEKLTEVNTISAQNAKNAIKPEVIKTSNAGYMFLKTILFLITILVSFFFFTRIYELISKLSLTLNNSYFQPVTLGWITITITLLIIINLLIMLFPFGAEETKSKVFKIESKVLVFLILLLVSFNALGADSLITNYTKEEQAQMVTENVQQNTVSLWDKIGCYITLNQECITEKMTTKTADTTSRSTYSLSLERPLQISKPLESWQTRPLTLNYKIASSGELTLDRIECYQEKIDSAHLLSNISLNNRVVNTDGQITDLPGLQCNFEKLKVKGDKKTEDITIIPILYLNLNTTYTIKIPIISEKLYTESTGEKGPIAYLDYKTIEYMKKNGKDFEVKQSNNALNFAVKGVANSFPLVYGNTDELNFDIPIEISENPSNSLGKIEEVTLAEEPTIPKYFVYEVISNQNMFSKSTDGNKILMNVYLKENEGQSEYLELPLIISNIDMKIKSTIKKEDMTTRFKITIRDIEITNQTITKQTQSTNYNFDELTSKYINLKQSIEEPYSETIQYKINDIENLISLTINYNNRELNPEETTIKNAYLYGLNTNINEFETIIKQTQATKNNQTYISPDP